MPGSALSFCLQSGHRTTSAMLFAKVRAELEIEQFGMGEQSLFVHSKKNGLRIGSCKRESCVEYRVARHGRTVALQILHHESMIGL